VPDLFQKGNTISVGLD